jgi:CRP-like cAMP-binding protein
MARNVTYKSGETIIKAGSREKLMYVILQGDVSVRLIEGNISVEVATMGKGGFFGEISFFSEIPRSADVIAKTECTLAAIDSLQQLNVFLQVNPKFAIKMVHILSERLAKTDELLLGKVVDATRVKTVEAALPMNGQLTGSIMDEIDSSGVL